MSKKVFYTLNHKRLGLMYFYFVFLSSTVGSYLATCIRLELAYPGSTIFLSDSLKYLQVISVHALIMIFYVIIPIFFGGFANLLVPHHLGCKDVAYPRLNNFGFWVQPGGFAILMRGSTYQVDGWSPDYNRQAEIEFAETDYGRDKFYYNEFLGKTHRTLSFDKLNLPPYRPSYYNKRIQVNMWSVLEKLMTAEVRKNITCREFLWHNLGQKIVFQRVGFAFNRMLSVDAVPMDQYVEFITSCFRGLRFAYLVFFSFWFWVLEYLLKYFSIYLFSFRSWLLHSVFGLFEKCRATRISNILYKNLNTNYFSFRIMRQPASLYIYAQAWGNIFTETQLDKINLLCLSAETEPITLIAGPTIVKAYVKDDIYCINGINNSFVVTREKRDYQDPKMALWADFNELSNECWQFMKNSLSPLSGKTRYCAQTCNVTQTVAGWSFIAPMSSNLQYTGWGVQDMLIVSVYFVGISTTISVFNILITRRVMAVTGLKSRRTLVPFITISLLLMLRTLSVITPVLGSAMLMLYADRHWRTSFFDFAYGGDPIFFQHLFWFFGHPEVYVLIIPAFGIVNSILPTISKRRMASKNHLIWAVYVMNYMGFLVWGHHMYLVGLDHRSRALYSSITVMISLPATVKVVNWSYTLVNGSLQNTLLLYTIISFILFFLVAGLTGMWLSHVSLNISMHDTLYVVAHFHLMLSGAVVMGIFSGFYYYFYVLFQLKYSRVFSAVHIIYYTIGQWFTFIPLFWLAFAGLPRRVHDFPAVYMGWQSVSTAGHFVTMIGVFAFYSGLIEALVAKKILTFLPSFCPKIPKRDVYFLLKAITRKMRNLFRYFSPRGFTRKYLRQTILYNKI